MRSVTPACGPFGRLAAAVLARRGLATALSLLAVALAIAAALGIRLDFSSAAFYGADDPSARALVEFQQRWGADDATLVVLAEHEGDAGVLEPEALASLADLAEQLRADPDVTAVTELGAIVGAFVPGDASLAETFGDASPRMRATLRAALRSSPAVPRLLSADGRRTVVLVELRRSSDDVQAVAPIVERLTEQVAAQPGPLRLRLAGVPAIRAAFFRLALGDQLRLGPLVGIALAALLALALRRLHGVVVPLVLAGVPVVGLVGLMAATDEPVGLLNQAYFTLLPVIAVADAVHLVSRFHEIVRRDGIDPRQAAPRRAAIIEACDRTGAACLWTSVTTGAGFMSLAFAQMPMLRRFGLYAAAGIALAYLALLLVGPLLLDTARARPAAAPRGLARLARWSARGLRPGVVILATLLLGGLAYVGGQQVVVDNRLSALLPADHPVREASAIIDEDLGGTLALEVELTAAEPWSSPAGQQTLQQLERWAQQQPEVRAVTGPASLASLDASDPPAATLRRRVLSDDDRVARVSLLTADIGGRRFTALAERTREHLAALADEGVVAVVTGTPLLAYRGVNRIADELRTSLVGLTIVVTLAIGLLLRSASLALLALVPNLMPLALAYAALGLLGIELDPLAAVILCVALGIAVDDTLHLLARLREGQRAGLPSIDALEQAVARSGHAALVTTVALAGGLAMNLGSSFPPLQLLGGLGAGTIALAWLFDVIVLPALLRAGSLGRPGRGET